MSRLAATASSIMWFLEAICVAILSANRRDKGPDSLPVRRRYAIRTHVGRALAVNGLEDGVRYGDCS